jgi:hypothetical protein
VISYVAGPPGVVTAAGILGLFAGLWFALPPAAAPGCRDESPESGLTSLLGVAGRYGSER